MIFVDDDNPPIDRVVDVLTVPLLVLALGSLTGFRRGEIDPGLTLFRSLITVPRRRRKS